jgi:hypothetical protein
MGKLPAFQFYPGDWRKDVGVQSLNYFDRGVWHEMLCLMHESERRGVLTLNGQAMSDDSLGRLLGLDKQTLTTTLNTLLTSGVASREAQTGAIFCRRMVRDEKLREVRAAAGKLGGNPLLLNQNRTTPDNHATKQTRTPSSSSSVSSSKTEIPESAKNADCSPDAQDHELFTEKSGAPTASRFQDAALREVFAYYLTVMRRNRATYTFSALRRKKGLARLEEAVRMAHGSLVGAVELMKAVVDEVAQSEFHMGRDPKTGGKSYCEWEDHLFRSTEQFEKWVQRYQEAVAREQR